MDSLEKGQAQQDNEGFDIVVYYNKHYIIREDNIVIDAWSDGPNPEKDTADAICINKHGSYQFRLYPDGEENPPMFAIDGISLYKWDGEQVMPRTEAEIEADRVSVPEPPPSEIERVRADLDFLAVMLGVVL